MGPTPTFKDRQFERMFRITRTMADRLISCLAKADSFFTQTYDACRNPSIAPVVKFLAGMKRLCYGVSFSAFQDYFQMGESTARLCVSRLTRGIVQCPEIRDVFLRPWSRADARRVCSMHEEQHGIPGMLGSLDVMKLP